MSVPKTLKLPPNLQSWLRACMLLPYMVNKDFQIPIRTPDATKTMRETLNPLRNNNII